MPSLLDLTSQGDVGTITDESKLMSVTLMTPQQLYELWERQNWQSHTIDFSQDVRDWRQPAHAGGRRTGCHPHCGRAYNARGKDHRLFPPLAPREPWDRQDAPS